VSDPRRPSLALRPSATAWVRAFAFAGLGVVLALVPALSSRTPAATVVVSALAAIAVVVTLTNAWARGSARVWMEGRDVLLSAGGPGSFVRRSTRFEEPSRLSIDVRPVEGGVSHEVRIVLGDRAEAVVADTEEGARAAAGELMSWLRRQAVDVVVSD